VVEHHPLTRRKRLIHGVGLEGLDSNHADLGRERLDVGRDPRDEPAPSHGNEDGVDPAPRVAEDLDSDGPLTRDHQGIVEGMNEDPTGLRRELVAAHLRVGVAVAGELDVGLHGPYGVDLDPRRRLRHHDERRDAQLPGGVGDALGVVARARGDDATPGFRSAQLRHLVVGAAELEAEHRLQILALQQNLVLETARQTRRPVERTLVGHVVDPARENPAEELVDFEGLARLGSTHGFHTMGKSRARSGP
jgi:hypothetical protein